MKTVDPFTKIQTFICREAEEILEKRVLSFIPNQSTKTPPGVKRSKMNPAPSRYMILK
jgi:hypothetical protein